MITNKFIQLFVYYTACVFKTRLSHPASLSFKFVSLLKPNFADPAT